MKKLDSLLKIAMKNGWTYDIGDQDGEHYIEFYQHSPAGEDFSFCVWYKTVNDLPVAVWDYYTDFDPEEHAGELYEAGKHGLSGVPSLRVLLDDADEIYDMLEQLARALVAAA